MTLLALLGTAFIARRVSRPIRSLTAASRRMTDGDFDARVEVDVLPGHAFHSAELRESAKVGLMKLALLMDRNPDLFCWIEGHTDLVGGDEFNLNLSARRAEAVKNYLVQSMRMDASKITTRGFGRFEPLVITGDVGQQAINRRVEIRMRKSPPTEAQMKIAPKRAAVIEEPPPLKPQLLTPAQPAPPESTPPKAVLVKPQRALPVEEAPPLRAQPVEVPPAPRATPVEE